MEAVNCTCAFTNNQTFLILWCKFSAAQTDLALTSQSLWGFTKQYFSKDILHGRLSTWYSAALWLLSWSPAVPCPATSEGRTDLHCLLGSVHLWLIQTPSAQVIYYSVFSICSAGRPVGFLLGSGNENWHRTREVI